MIQNYNKAISLIIPLIVQNNAGKTAIVLRQLGYEKKSIIPAAELEAKLFQLHTANPEKFYQALNSIEWLNSETETNKPQIKNNLIAITGMQETPETKGLWWKKLVSMLRQQSIMNQSIMNQSIMNQSIMNQSIMNQS